jgi:hypothetical protein
MTTAHTGPGHNDANSGTKWQKEYEGVMFVSYHLPGAAKDVGCPSARF